jgi:hypothetical protein
MIKVEKFIDRFGDEEKGTLVTKKDFAGLADTAIAAHNTDSAAHEDIRAAIPSETEIEGIADSAIAAHNTDGAAHDDIRTAIANEILDRQDAMVYHNTAEDSHEDIREQINGLSTLGGGWLGQNFPTYADLEAFDQNRPAGFETIPDKTWARVFDDENHDNALTVYAWFNNALAYQYTMVIDPRNFSTDPIQTAEIAASAVTDAKIADGTISKYKHASIGYYALQTDTTDYSTNYTSTLPNFAQNLAEKIKGLHSVVVKTSGNQTIGGTKTFSTAPVIPAAADFPASPSPTKPATEAQLGALSSEMTAALNNKVSKTTETNKLYGTGPSGQPVLYPTDQFYGLDDFRFCGESYLSTDQYTGEKFVDVKLIPVFSVLASNTTAIIMAGGAYFNQPAFKAYWTAENGALAGAGWSPSLSGGDTVWSLSDRPTGAVGIQIIDTLHSNKLLYRTAISKSKADVLADVGAPLPVSSGGTGLAAVPAGRLLAGNGTAALASVGTVGSALLPIYLNNGVPTVKPKFNWTAAEQETDELYNGAIIYGKLLSYTNSDPNVAANATLIITPATYAGVAFAAFVDGSIRLSVANTSDAIVIGGYGTATSAIQDWLRVTLLSNGAIYLQNLRTTAWSGSSRAITISGWVKYTKS